MGPHCEGYWSCWHHFTCELNQRVLMIVIDLISHSCMSCHFSTSYDFCPSFLLPQLQTAYFFPFRLPHNLLLLRQIHLFQIKRQIHTPKSINALSLSAVTHQRSSLFSLKMDPPTKLLVYAILEDQKISLCWHQNFEFERYPLSCMNIYEMLLDLSTGNQGWNSLQFTRYVDCLLL